MPWQTIDIDGKTADVFHVSSDAGPQRAILHMHGHSGQTLKDNPTYSELLEKHQLNCICPHGKRSWWLDRICAEYDATTTPMTYLRESIIPWIAREWNIVPPAIGLTGISMGGQGVLQLAYREPRRFPVVAALAPAVDFQQWYGQRLPLDEMFESREAARQETAILQFHPLNWPRFQFFACDPADLEWFDSADKLAMKLGSSGVTFECDLKTSHGGHDWSYFNFQAEKMIGWVAQKLEQVSRQI